VTGRDESGAALPLVALCVVVLLLAVGFTVDLGSLAARTRRLQGLADLLALDAAKELNGQECQASYRKSGEAVASTQYDHVVAAAVASGVRNGHTVAGNRTLNVELGTLTRDGNGDIVYSASGKPTFNAIAGCASSSTHPEAVRVIVGDRVAYEFARVVGFSGQSPTRSAIGVQRPIGALTIGSYVGTVDSTQSAMMNSILGSMLCAAVTPCNASLSAAGYNGLAASHVTLADLQAAGGFASPDALLNANLTAAQIFTYAATAESGSTVADSNAKTALGQLATSSTSTTKVKLRDFITVQQGGTDADGNDIAGETGVNLMSLVQASAALMNGSGAVSIPAAAITTAGLPVGVSSLTASLDLVEGPKSVVGQPGVSVTTKQVRMTLTPTLNVSVLSGFASPAAVTGTMPIVITGGTGTGTLTATSCYTGGAPGITTSTQVQATSTSVSGSLTVKTLLGITLGTLTMTGTGASTTTGTFADDFDHAAEYYTAVNHGNHQVGLSTTNVSASTFKTVLGITSAIPAAVATAIVSAIAPLDAAIVERVTNLLGVGLGSADIMAIEPLICNAPTIGA
jgi:uncharacterized membrane protein